ncbi:MAG: hypothetical protein U0L49_09960 [Eubacterium sp.]|nr:hypothetical protein [Eubacterium sp.]
MKKLERVKKSRRLLFRLTAAVAAVAAAFSLLMGSTETASAEYTETVRSDEYVDMYRLYNPETHEHLYTANAAERDMLVEKAWNYEGIGWYAPRKSNVPVYRLFNPYSGDHHYTMKEKEKDWLVSLGWNYEGIGWYSDPQCRQPLFREFYPHLKIGAHNYTAKKAEHDWLCSSGWNDEGVGWYGVPESDIYITIHHNAPKAEDFVASVINVCNMAKSNNWYYWDSHSKVPCEDGKISCDRLISRALYDMGFTDQPKGGYTLNNGIYDWLTSIGYNKSESFDDIRYGSIVFVTHVGHASYDHCFVVDSYDKDTMILKTYDMGSNWLIQHNMPVQFKWNYDTEHFLVFNP